MVQGGIPSVRGLEDVGTPLRKFRGTLDSVPPPEDRYGKSRVTLNFRDVEVIESVEPYHFPIAQISMNQSNRKNSNWGVFGNSLAKLLSKEEDLKDCIGRRFGMVMELGRKYGENQQTGEDLIGNPWHVFELDGKVPGGAAEGAKDALETARELLNNKTRADFNAAAFADETIRKDTNLQQAIIDKSFITAELQLGNFEEDAEGVFHRVQEEAAAPALAPEAA